MPRLPFGHALWTRRRWFGVIDARHGVAALGAGSGHEDVVAAVIAPRMAH
jgi:hypothetical protein